MPIELNTASDVTPKNIPNLKINNKPSLAFGYKITNEVAPKTFINNTETAIEVKINPVQYLMQNLTNAELFVFKGIPNIAERLQTENLNDLFTEILDKQKRRMNEDFYLESNYFKDFDYKCNTEKINQALEDLNLTEYTIEKLTLNNIKQASNKLLLKYHPDKNCGTTEDFMRIKNARDFLIQSLKTTIL